MKKYLCSVGAWVALAAMTASGQTSSSGGSQSTSGSTQGSTSSSQSTTSGTQGTTSTSQGNLPPGLQNRNPLPPGLQNRDQLPPGLAKRTNSVSNFGATNQNQFGSAAGNTNSSELYPTGRSSNTNRTYGTNSSSRSSSYGTNNNSYGARNERGQGKSQDEAVSPSDQKLLVTVRERVQTQVRELTSTVGAWAPVHFRIHDGIVTIIGTVQTIEIKQRVESCVRQVPGVIQVEDTIEVAGGQDGGGDSDQILLTRVRERVLPQIQISGIDFQCHGGVVTVIGAVPREDEKERLVTLVRQVPGVVNVTDQVTVNTEIKGQSDSGRRASSRPEGVKNPPVKPKSGRPEAGQSESNRAVNAAVETSKTNNLAPTGRTNSLPPGLEKKDQLPPGLQNRQQLPPGLSKGTNSAAQPNP